MNFYGNQKAKQTLLSLIEKNSSHSYLLYGPSGLGKRTLAKEMAKIILKSEQAEFHSDLILFDGSEDAGIETIRQVRKRVSLSSQFGGFKVVLGFNIDKMSEESLNALLKSLEEPNEGVVFILTASSAILKTIESRCFLIKLFPISTERMESFQKEALFCVEKGLLALGKPGIALKKMQQTEKINLQVMCSMDINDRFALAEKICKSMEKIFFLLYNWIGEARIALKEARTRKEMSFAAQTLKELLDCYGLIGQSGANTRLILENLFLKV
ncbi:MAG: AAA family ATPase [bacterium]